MKKTLKYSFNTFLDFLFPVSGIEKYLHHIDTTDLADRRESEPLKVQWMRARFSYKDRLIRKIIWLLKYKRNTRAADLCAQIIYEEISELIYEKHFFENTYNPLVLPVAMHKKRKRNRGYNHMELVGKYISNVDKDGLISVRSDLLRKSKNTPPQTTLLGKKKREQNLKDSFEIVLPDEISGRLVVVIDDVITTGSTLTEIRKLLLRHGAKKVYGIAVAH